MLKGRYTNIIMHIYVSSLTILSIFLVLMVLALSRYHFFLTIRRITYLVNIHMPGYLYIVFQVLLHICLFSGIMLAFIEDIRNLCLLIPLVLSLVGLIIMHSYILLIALFASIMALIYLIVKHGRVLLLTIAYATLALLLISLITQLMCLLGTEFPNLYITIVYIAWSLQPLLPYLYLTTLFISLASVFLDFTARTHHSIPKYSKISLTEVKYVLLGSVLSLLFYIAPYTKILNPNGYLVTVDVLYYHKWLQEMSSSANPPSYALATDRPLYLLLLYAIKNLLGIDDWTLSIISGWLWAPLLPISLWYLAREVYGPEIGMLTAILTPISHQSLSFIYGGYHANQLNLILLYLAISLLLNPHCRRRVIAGLFLLLISPYVHLWSWLHIITPFTAWFLKNWYKKNRLLSISVLAVFILTIATRYETIFKLSEFTDRLNPSFNVYSFFSNVRSIFSYYLWNTLAISPLYVSAFTYQILRIWRNRPSDILDWLNSATLVAHIVLSSDLSLAARLCLNIPIQIFTALLIKSAHKILKKVLFLILLNIATYIVINAVP